MILAGAPFSPGSGLEVPLQSRLPRLGLKGFTILAGKLGLERFPNWDCMSILHQCLNPLIVYEQTHKLSCFLSQIGVEIRDSLFSFISSLFHIRKVLITWISMSNLRWHCWKCPRCLRMQAGLANKKQKPCFQAKQWATLSKSLLGKAISICYLAGAHSQRKAACSQPKSNQSQLAISYNELKQERSRPAVQYVA